MASRAGPCACSPRTPSRGSWSRPSATRPFVRSSRRTTSSRGGGKMWCVPDLTPPFIARMEDVLDTYAKPPDPTEPVVGLDEKPVQLVEHVRDPVACRPGQVARYDYEYLRC